MQVLWASIRWDDLSTKPPTGGTNTITTETDITTTELLKRRDMGPFSLRSEYLVRKIVVPIGMPSSSKSECNFSPIFYSFVICFTCIRCVFLQHEKIATFFEAKTFARQVTPCEKLKICVFDRFLFFRKNLGTLNYHLVLVHLFVLLVLLNQ